MKYRIFFVALALTVTLGVTSATLRNDNLFQIAKNLDIFATLFREINTYYVDEIDPEEFVNAGIKAMLESLDPYTDYIAESNLEDYRTVTTGQYGGIGALVGKRNENSVIIMPYEGFPAHNAGLKIGDIVTKIDGIDITGTENNETSKLLKGKSDTPVILTIKRFGVEEEFDVTIIRDKITISNVPYYDMVDERTGYIKLSDFTTDASMEVKQSLKSLKEKGAKNVILDLRGNPGGLLDEAVNVANLFIAKGSLVVSTKGKTDNWNQEYKAQNQPEDDQIPIVVLTDRGSASASEIVAGVIQDYDRGVLVGRQTFGKGLVQSTRPLAFNAQLKLTTAKYYIPSGRCIQAIDYSLRNADGSVGAIPDSLKVAFKTTNGREVFDGGGVNPDISIDAHKFSSLAYFLVNNNFIFDFATKYYYENEKIAHPRNYKFTDEEYQQFIDWVSDNELEYTTQVDKQIDELVINAKQEKYFAIIEEEIEQVKHQLKKQKEEDLIRFKEEIKKLIEQEIISRYYLQPGVIEYSFKYDQDIKQALEIFSNQDTYKSLLKAS